MFSSRTNPVLVEFRDALKGYADKRLALSHYIDYVKGSVYGWTEAERDHAYRVLYRLWLRSAKYIDLEPGKSYWITFRDGSRIKVEVLVDSRGEMDAKNEILDFSMWVGRNGEPVNRENVRWIQEVE